jgi:hypothetical protein
MDMQYDDLFESLEAREADLTLLLLRASWLRVHHQEAEREALLPARGVAVPEEARVSPAELRARFDAAPGCKGYRKVDLPFITVAQFWRAHEHPDPEENVLQGVIQYLQAHWEEVRHVRWHRDPMKNALACARLSCRALMAAERRSHAFCRAARHVAVHRTRRRHLARPRPTGGWRHGRHLLDGDVTSAQQDGRGAARRIHGDSRETPGQWRGRREHQRERGCERQREGGRQRQERQCAARCARAIAWATVGSWRACSEWLVVGTLHLERRISLAQQGVEPWPRGRAVARRSPRPELNGALLGRRTHLASMYVSVYTEREMRPRGSDPSPSLAVRRPGAGSLCPSCVVVSHICLWVVMSALSQTVGLHGFSCGAPRVRHLAKHPLRPTTT